MSRRLNSLSARITRLERFRRPKGDRFFLIWGRDQIELTDALNRAKTAGEVRVGDRFDARIWTCPTQPPPARSVSLDEVSHEELVILAGGEAKIASSDATSNSAQRF